jgi:CheY-like chemotaxis protein/HPt (histidine-containing phosphotransfer) domain-containing protein
MDQDTLLAQLREAFRLEAAERLGTLSAALLALAEPASDDAVADTHLQQAHRDFHSLKGAAQAVDMEEIATVCLKGEKVLKQLRDAPDSMTPEHVDTLLAAVATVERVGLSEISLPAEEMYSLGKRLDEVLAALGGEHPVSAATGETPPAQETAATDAASDLDAVAALAQVRSCIDQLPTEVDTTQLHERVDALERVLARRQDVLRMLLDPTAYTDQVGSLPRAPRADRAKQDDGTGTAPQPNPKRILLVEDSPTSRMLVQSILEEEGYLVLTAVDGVEGYARLKSSGADLVVSDVEMPRMDGFQMSQTIRKDMGFRHVPIILVTSLTGEENRARGMEAGADAYIVKTELEQDKLLDIVRELISKR